MWFAFIVRGYSYFIEDTWKTGLDDGTYQNGRQYFRSPVVLKDSDKPINANTAEDTEKWMHGMAKSR